LADKPLIAHISGPNATIQNSPALVTSNKARAKYGLPPMTNPGGSPPRFDVLRAQRLAAPVTVYVEQFSAHPLECDAAALYGPPDGYLDSSGTLHKARTNDADKPVYEIELRPEDGLYPLPYMARQIDGRPWEEDCAEPLGPANRARQPFYPDGSRVFEEIDRFGISDKGKGNLISAKADIEFHRVMPPSGYTQGYDAALRTDIGEGDIPCEVRGKDFFPYHPPHIAEQPPRPGLARIANGVQKILGSGNISAQSGRKAARASRRPSTGSI
jgi:L-asparaginase